MQKWGNEQAQGTAPASRPLPPGSGIRGMGLLLFWGMDRTEVII